MDKSATISLGALAGTRYSKVLNYPASDDRELEERINELRTMGITAIRFAGSSMLDGVAILGKGWVGLVTEAILDGESVALKIRRLDADRPSMYAEARLLRLANSVHVGPQLINATKNFLAMELFDGLSLFSWANDSARSRGSLRIILSRLLNSCFRLDSIGLDHGELSRAPKNVLIGPKAGVCIVDFESASMVRRVANVTSLLQYFLFGSISKSLDTLNIFPRRSKILRALTQYKDEGSVTSYLSLLETLRLKHYYDRRIT